MKNLFSLLLVTSVVFGAGCSNKKRTTAAVQQKETVVETIIFDEPTSKEDYSIVA